eukprot:CAMPEP_0118665182 /NCGR_PEP_ID=MMETSP0785-20121206/18477_1 /TAXON_ID=91992 /ORGANISM="Bolidomonas pacifica, Strain CCMP 1866" /LENGTH=244 /DNA_ID=CAMNT_0006559273 /DNA_START=44 /DNA_END=775 /DNA_ORIENTATION=-
MKAALFYTFVFISAPLCSTLNVPFTTTSKFPPQCEISRRSAILSTTGLLTTLPFVSSASASGGATAGKYTTIPIAKRRYYGRVQEAVHEYLMMGQAVVKGDMSAKVIQDFFDPKGIVTVEARNQAVNGQCTKKDQSCKGAEIRDSRYNDMETSMYLLGNAFRFNQQKAPDNLPTVKAAKAFFKDLDEMEKNIKGKKSSPQKAQSAYLRGLEKLDLYLDLVELPPTDSGAYDKEFDTRVAANARI